MNKIMNNTLNEVENSSDDFFQSKHIYKRKKDFIKEFDKKKKEALYKLTKGLEEIKIAYKSKNWKDEKEKLFLELFSKLCVDKAFYQDEYMYGYYLLDLSDAKICILDLKNDRFWIDFFSIWKNFEKQFNMNYVDVKLLMNDMLRGHFKLYDVTGCEWM